MLTNNINNLGQFINKAADAFLTPFVTTKPLHFIGLGDAGTNTIIDIQPKIAAAKYTCITHPYRPNLPNAISCIDFTFPSKESQVSKHRFFSLLDLTEPFIVPKNIADLFTDDANYVLVSGLGGATGTKLTLALTQQLAVQEKPFVTIVYYPFAFEGIERKAIADAFINMLSAVPQLYCMELESFKTEYSKQQWSELFAAVSERVASMFSLQVASC